MSTAGGLKIAIFDPTNHPSSCLHCHRSYLKNEGICYEEAAAEPKEYWHAHCYLSHKLSIPPRDAVPTEESRTNRFRAVEAMLPADCRKDAVRYYADLSIGPVCRLKPLTEESEKHYKTLTGVRLGHDTFKLVLKELRDKMSTVLESPLTPLPTSSWIKKLTPEGKQRVLEKGDALRSYLFGLLQELAKRQVKDGSIIGGQNHGMIIDARYVVGLYREVVETLVEHSGFHMIDQGNADEYCAAIKIAQKEAPTMGITYMPLCVSYDLSASFWSEDTRATCTGDPAEDWLEMYQLVKARLNVEDPFIIALMATFWVTARLGRQQVRSTGGGGDGGDDWGLGGLFDDGADGPGGGPRGGPGGRPGGGPGGRPGGGSGGAAGPGDTPSSKKPKARPSGSKSQPKTPGASKDKGKGKAAVDSWEGDSSLGSDPPEGLDLPKLDSLSPDQQGLLSSVSPDSDVDSVLGGMAALRTDSPEGDEEQAHHLLSDLDDSLAPSLPTPTKSKTIVTGSAPMTPPTSTPFFKSKESTLPSLAGPSSPSLMRSSRGPDKKPKTQPLQEVRKRASMLFNALRPGKQSPSKKASKRPFDSSSMSAPEEK